MEGKSVDSKRIREIYRELLGFCSPHFKKQEVVKLRKAYEYVLLYHRPNWEATGEDAAPKYIRIEGVGKVDGIRDAIFKELDTIK